MESQLKGPGINFPGLPLGMPQNVNLQLKKKLVTVHPNTNILVIRLSFQLKYMSDI